MNINNLLSKDDTYSTAMVLLSANSDNPKYSTINELAYILDHKNFLSFMDYFSGQTIKVPTKKEVCEAFRVLLLYQYYKVDKLQWDVAMEKAGYQKSETYIAVNKLNNFITYIDTHDCKIGGLLNALK